MIQKWATLGEDNWNVIIKRYYNSKDNEEELIKWLTDLGYKTKQLCDNDSSVSNKFDCERKLNNMVDYIQQNTAELVSLREKKKYSNLH